MDIGINLATEADSWKIVQRAEALGYTRVWFYDTQMLNADVFVAMAAAAMVTAKIRLGTGVLIPSNRIAPAAACALASVNALAPGRIDFGISTGSTARSTMGLGPVKLAALRDISAWCRACCGARRSTWDFEGKRRKIRFLNPEIGAINIADRIPLHISAAGPKARHLTAELGADWIVPTGSIAHASASIADMHRAWREAGQDPARHVASAVVGGCVLADGEAPDSPRAKQQAGPHAMIRLHNAIEAEDGGFTRPPLPPHLAPLLERYRELSRLPPGRCALSQQSSRPPHVPAPGGASALHRRADPGHHLYRHRNPSCASGCARSATPATTISRSPSGTATPKCSRNGSRCLPASSLRRSTRSGGRLLHPVERDRIAAHSVTPSKAEQSPSG